MRRERKSFKDANTCIVIVEYFNVIVHVLVMMHSPPQLVKYTHSVCTSVTVAITFTVIYTLIEDHR